MIAFRSGDLRSTFCPFPSHFYYLFPSTLPHFYHLSPSKVFPIKLDPGLFSHLSLSPFYPHTPTTVLPISWTLMANAHIYMDLANTHKQIHPQSHTHTNISLTQHTGKKRLYASDIHRNQTHTHTQHTQINIPYIHKYAHYTALFYLQT